MKKLLMLALMVSGVAISSVNAYHCCGNGRVVAEGPYTLVYSSSAPHVEYEVSETPYRLTEASSYRSSDRYSETPYRLVD